MLARLVQRWSLVDGGSLPGSTKAPITPPSNRMVSPGQRSRCASVAARSGMPIPANTTWPSLSCRALRIASVSDAVWRSVSVIENAPAPAAYGDDFFDADHRQELVPVLRAVDVVVEIFLHAADRIAVDLFHVGVEVIHHRLIDAVAFVRRRAVGHLDDRVDAEERYLGLVGRAPDLVVGDNALRSENHPVGGHRKIDVHELQAVDL